MLEYGKNEGLARSHRLGGRAHIRIPQILGLGKKEAIYVIELKLGDS